MPSQEGRACYQTCMLWEQVGYDTFGQPTVDATPIQLTPPNGVRWDDVYKETRDPHGNTVTIEAVVVVKRDIPVGSVLWLGTLIELGGSTQVPTSKFMQVYSFDGTPDIRNRAIHRKVQLMRCKDDSFPTRVTPSNG